MNDNENKKIEKLENLIEIIGGILDQQSERICILEVFYNNQFKNKSRGINKNIRYLIMKNQKWRCNICNISIKFSKDSNWEGELGHIDHIIPYSKKEEYDGNINSTENLQALCSKCNREKWNRL